MDGEELKRALQELFESQVMNHGDYSRVYAQSIGPGPDLVLGYRRTSLELVLCPVEAQPGTRRGEGKDMVRQAGPVSSIDLTNVATVADTGTGYRVQTVTGFRAWFEVTGTLPIPGAVATDMVVLEQDEDAEDFHQFMGHFMDVLDAFYHVPDTIESLRTLPASA
jgi:hypothetical protein